MSFRKRINNVLFIDFVYCERMLKNMNYWCTYKLVSQMDINDVNFNKNKAKLNNVPANK